MKTRPKGGEGSCCAPDCCQPKPASADVMRIDSVITWADRYRHFRCRTGSFRTKYMVKPGLYAIGSPGKDSDVFVSANYGLSFDKLRAGIEGIDAWILVLDTKGINVWCAAGKGTFGTDELVKKIFSTGLFSVVSHRRLILPQLGGPGVAAHEVKRQTGFRVIYGPVKAADIKAFVAAGYKATPEMRRVGFGLADRLVLTPMEIRPALRVFALFAIVVFVVTGAGPTGISFSGALNNGVPLFVLGLLSILAGAFLTPMLLPWVPFRSFAMKGWLIGIAMVLFFDWLGAWSPDVYISMAKYIFFPLASSYIALQFTGSTVYTGLSGVQKELRYSLPVYIGGTAVSFILLAAFKLKTWGLL